MFELFRRINDWKLSLQKWGRGFLGSNRAFQYWIAIFIATSTDTDPESEKNTETRESGVIAINFSASVTAGE